MIKLLSVAIVAALFLESHQWIPIGPTDPEDPVCWTDWFDRDNPSGSGDWELLKDLKKEIHGNICEYPLHIKVVTTDTMTPAISTGQTFYTFHPTQGFVCRNKDQSKDMCRDYKVSFLCPCRLVEP
ncbi:cartilage intermediate layer protein 1-like [Gymnodraco acuticeps]|uniref:Cartilage intermediate layer protein 1-like n=1 Tax=Gymnodraco acuticeps TaxID=8218 RepID=A0A6P8TPP3_GYMAC|nr:cartilage intermediate layer protein 1-like [Gymnodraco acuticeps]